MKAGLLIFFLAACVSCPAAAQDTIRVYRIARIEVDGKRPLEDIGVQKTVLDSFALRENVTNSLSDVMAQSSAIFIKSYGRATLSTASFRGTAPSHTQVSWNGMQVASPMLGMVDFSLIPSYFIDEAKLYHGASSVGVAGGGLGGAVTLGTRPLREEGFGLRLIQGVGSYGTFDEFLRLTWGSARWHSSTRVYYSLSDNDFRYTNIYKWDYTYDEDHNITGRRRPEERNRNGGFSDFHILQEFYYTGPRGSHWGLSAWWMDSGRGVPMLNVNWREADDSKNRQNEKTFRGVLSWEREAGRLGLSARAGYTYMDLFYHWLQGLGGGKYSEAVRSESYVNTAFASAGAKWNVNRKLVLSADAGAHQHLVDSRNKPNEQQMENSGIDADSVLGYDQGRFELSALVSVQWKPTERLGLGMNLRGEVYGEDFASLIPAGFAEYLISKKGAVYLKASVARNYRPPTLNDMYFKPGGNPALRSERGVTWDAGAQFTAGRKEGVLFHGQGTYFDSYIDDWILWVMTQFGWWTPVNLAQVHSYGFEFKGDMSARLARRTWLVLAGNYTLSNAINRGEPSGPDDQSVGKQLVYIPRHSASATGRLAWRSWQAVYKWVWYSERYTTSSNEITRIGRVAPYFMSDVSLEKSFSERWGDVNLKFTVDNIFDEKYESVLSRPMPGRNFGFFVEFAPSFKRKR